MDLTPARRELTTGRLWLQAGDDTLAFAVADFYRRNRRRFDHAFAASRRRTPPPRIRHDQEIA